MTEGLQLSPKWRCNFLHFYFATFGIFILQQTWGDNSEQTQKYRKDMLAQIDDAKDYITNSDSVVIGDVVSFGSYEQDGYLENGNEDIRWFVVDADQNEVLLMSCMGLDYVCYSTNEDELKWSESYLRKWLNQDFFTTAFDEKERRYILTKELRFEDEDLLQSEYIRDKVFVPSYKEAETLENQQVMLLSEYAKEKQFGDSKELRTSDYYIREKSEENQAVILRGPNYSYGVSPLVENAVRPCIWVKRRS